MHALFVGGVVDNSEIDLDGAQPPKHYPEDGGSGASRYRLHQVGVGDDGAVVYGVYGAPDVTDAFVEQVAADRGYARRFRATPRSSD